MQTVDAKEKEDEKVAISARVAEEVGVEGEREDTEKETESIKKCALATCMQHKDLKACSACNEVVYCCREHQVEHFKEGGHRFICPGRTKGERGKPPLAFAECNEKAGNYYSQRMWLAALPYYSAMLELTERTLSGIHPQVGNLLHVIANCFKELGKVDKAILCLQRMIVIREINNDGSEEKNKGYHQNFCIFHPLNQSFHSIFTPCTSNLYIFIKHHVTHFSSQSYSC